MLDDGFRFGLPVLRLAAILPAVACAARRHKPFWHAQIRQRHLAYGRLRHVQQCRAQLVGLVGKIGMQQHNVPEIFKFRFKQDFQAALRARVQAAKRAGKEQADFGFVCHQPPRQLGERARGQPLHRIRRNRRAL